jgi:CheY-like chemotaxis protein
MNAEMAFECLFVSHDPVVFRTVGQVLRDLSISTSICMSPERAAAALEKGTTDLLVIDWDGATSSELLQKVWLDRKGKAPTVLAVSDTDRALPGVHIVLKKPVTVEASRSSLKTAYCRMLIDHRRHARHALMKSVEATAEDGRTLSIIVLDIGDGGIGFTTKEDLKVGDVFSFRLQLPGATREILINVRVLWARDYGRFGCEFLRIPPVDLMILHDWLKDKQRIKRPLHPF